MWEGGGSYYLPWQTAVSCTFHFLIHVQSLGHSICSINGPECAVDCANPGEGGGRELGQRGENPDFVSSRCLHGPLHWASVGVAQGLIRVFSVAGPSFHRPWAGRDVAEHPGIRWPVKAAPFSWAWIPGGPVSEWSPWGGRNTVAGLGSPLSGHAG